MAGQAGRSAHTHEDWHKSVLSVRSIKLQAFSLLQSALAKLFPLCLSWKYTGNAGVIAASLRAAHLPASLWRHVCCLTTRLAFILDFYSVFLSPLQLLQAFVWLATGLEKYGHNVTLMGSSEAAICQTVVLDPDTGTLTAVSDPRKDGSPAGY